MPIYEYKCKACGRLTSQFFRNAETEKPPACQHCGGKTARALSRFAAPSAPGLYQITLSGEG